MRYYRVCCFWGDGRFVVVSDSIYWFLSSLYVIMGFLGIGYIDVGWYSKLIVSEIKKKLYVKVFNVLVFLKIKIR